MAEQLFGMDVVATPLVPPGQVVVADWKFGRSQVPTWAAERALAAFASFVGRAGMRMRPFRHNGQPSDGLTRVTGAVLDHPDVTAEEWDEVVRRTLADPWWKGRPSIGVVFGPAVVERNIARLDDPAGPAERLTSNGALLRALRDAG